MLKKNKKMLVGTIVALLIVAVITATAVFALSNEKALAILNDIVSDENNLEENDLNGDGEVDVLDAILAIRQANFDGPELTSLVFDDDDYSVKFDGKILSYTVKLPAGRPKIPKLVPTAAEGCSVVKIENATISDTESWGCARVTVSDGNKSNTYTVKFVRAEVVDSVVLQYDDRYTFIPDYTLAKGEKFTFESSNAAVVSVDENGVLTAENVSDTAVTVRAMVDSVEIDRLTVTRVDKARVNLFFVTGQSNAQGCYDYLDVTGDGKVTDEDRLLQAPAQIAAVERPETSGRVYSYDVYPRIENPEAGFVVGTLYDMAEVPRQGFASALGKTYYNLSGEKVVFLQSAYNASPIERWLDPDVQGALAENNGNHYDDTQNAYLKLMECLDENLYDINHRANFWLQGETCMGQWWDYANNTWGGPPTAGHTLLTDEDYANMFLKFTEQLEDDFEIKTNNILLARAHSSDSLNPDDYIKAAINEIRAAQYGLANRYDNITIVSRLSDWVVIDHTKYIGTPYEPYMGFMGVGDIHYNQIGHNANGRIAATNYFKSIDVDTNSVATSVEIINTDGIERLKNGKTIEIELGKTKRLAAFALPEYCLENVTWKSSDEKVATVDEFGLITVIGVGEADITATAESGVKASVTVKGWAKKLNQAVHYRWDFDENLTSSEDANDLRLSDFAEANGAAGNYKYVDGAIVVDKSIAEKSRPDFTMQYPVTVSSETDWTIEWKANFYAHSVFLGQTCCNINLAGKDRQVNHLYSIYSSTNAAFGKEYPLRFVDSTAADHWLTYTAEYNGLNTSGRNVWKLDYKASSGILALYVQSNDEWVLVDSIDGGTFSATFDTVLGRYNANGMVNFCGEMDYLDIKVSPVEDYTVYEWNFDSFISSTNKNDLTPTATTGYTISGGQYTTTGRTDELVMEKAITLDSSEDWVIEWSSAFTGLQNNSLFGTENCSGTYNHIYLAADTYTGDFKSPVRILFDSTSETKQVDLHFVEGATDKTASVNMVKGWAFWKITYDSDTRVMALWTQTGSDWSLCDSEVMSEDFTMTFTRMFGDFNGNKMVNMYGTVDHVKVTFVDKSN